MSIACKICGSKNTSLMTARDTMYGMTGEFIYVCCHNCECIFQKDCLTDYSPYYPDGYYSMRQPHQEHSLSATIKQIKRRERNRYYYFSTGWLGWLLSRFKPATKTHLSQHIKLTLNSRLLDVGCGSGEFLSELAEIGIKQAHGVDPFTAASVTLENGVKLFKGDLGQFLSDAPFGGIRYDIIRFSHSFEHLTNPLETLSLAKQLLAPGGRIIINIPLADSYAARTYKENWVQLDAPRHIYLFSKKSMAILAEQAGLKISDIFYDSTGFQLWGSEQCRQGILLRSDRSLATSRKSSIFSEAELKVSDLEAEKLNQLQDGDQAGFILTLV